MRLVRARLGREAEHGAYVEGLALRHEAKRTFVKLLREPPP
jgi:hypothetical protein